jgi:DNA-binding response OmpR family regulator
VRILIVEDNQRLAAFIAAGLTTGGFGVDVSHSIEETEAALRVLRYDALVLDLGLPDGDGLGFLRTLRIAGDATPVLVLTARDDLRDRVAGLDTGADDYLVKPFALEELGARLRALLRRPGAILGRSLECGNLVLDTAERTVTIGGRPLALSRREFEVLEHLMRRVGNVVSKRLLEDNLYGLGDDSSPNAIEVLISRLRRRLQTQPSGVSYGWLYLKVDATARALREKTLIEQGHQIGQYLSLAHDGSVRLDLPAKLSEAYNQADGEYHYAVREQNGQVLFASGQEIGPLPIFKRRRHKAYHYDPDGPGDLEFFGAAVQVSVGPKTLIVQVEQAGSHTERLIDEVTD